MPQLLERWAMVRLLVILCLLGSWGCGDPCKALAVQVCNCELNTAARTSCLKRVNAVLSQRTANPNKAVERSGLAACSALAETCSCDALRTGAYNLCGLSYEPPPE